MNIPIHPFMWIMACLPIIVLLFLLIKCDWSVTKAAFVGLTITIFTGIFFYKGDVLLVLVEGAKGIWNALTIWVIIWTAVFMYQVGNEAKAFLVIRNGMRKLLPNELLLVLAMGWIFESFLQGITGFGVPVAVGAPLLIGIGVTPLWAVIIPLFGQSWGNTFGTLGAAWDSLVMSAGLKVGSSEYFVTAFWTAAFLFLWNVIVGFVVCWFYGKRKALKKGCLAVILLSAIQGGGELIFSQIDTTISCFVPACLSLLAILLLSKARGYRDEWKIKDSPIMNRDFGDHAYEESSDMSLVQAFVPYFVLSAITLIVLVVEPIHSFFGQISFGFSFPETMTGYGYVNDAVENYSAFSPFTHASTFLFLSAMIGFFYYKMNGWIKAGGFKRVFIKSISMTMSSCIAMVELVVMSKIMGGTGQTVELANGIANVLGGTYIILAPFVGLLGTFMTGSNMSSNILFGDFQMTTAKALNVNAAAILGAQSSGAAIGCVSSPSNIVLGTTTANILGSEGEILKRIIVITLPATILIGIILYSIIRIC